MLRSLPDDEIVKSPPAACLNSVWPVRPIMLQILTASHPNSDSITSIRIGFSHPILNMHIPSRVGI